MKVDNLTLSLEESVYKQLEREILDGTLLRGEALTECALSRRLGVSRTPVRAALHRLSEDGLVSITPNKGAVVEGVGTEDLVGTYKVRIRLEGLASREAARNVCAEESARLHELLDLYDYYITRGDAEHLKELDGEFHNLIYKASGNRALTRTLSELHRNIKRYRKLSLSVPERLLKSAEEHKKILDAIERGDGEEADRLTTLHVRAALDNLLSLMN